MRYLHRLDEGALVVCRCRHSAEWLVEVLCLDLDLTLTRSQQRSQMQTAVPPRSSKRHLVASTKPCRCLRRCFASSAWQILLRCSSCKGRKIAWSKTSIADRPLLGHTEEPSPEMQAASWVWPRPSMQGVSSTGCEFEIFMLRRAWLRAGGGGGWPPATLHVTSSCTLDPARK